MRVREFDPKDGQAFQGDIAIVPMPASIAIARIDQVAPIDGRLIIQEGEASGHQARGQQGFWIWPHKSP